MAHSARQSIYAELASIRIIDPHTHINPLAPAASTLADLLGYHYYTELAHSAGMPKELIEVEGHNLQENDPRELVRRLVGYLKPIENTAQYRWLVELCRKFFGFDGDRIDDSNWEQLYEQAERQLSHADWSQMVLDQSNVEAVFLTNDFDDALKGFDTETFIPCLRTDDLVFQLTNPHTRARLAAASQVELDGSLDSLRRALRARFDHFVSRGARACAISLPPSFEPTQVSDGRAATALDHVLRHDRHSDASHQAALSRRVFWTLAELCDEFGMPFDLMIGVNRGVYRDGVYQGRDLYDSRVSLIQYRELFNAFPQVKFPISVLASVTNQELVSYAWIFPNVVTNGHWWYSNTPSFIARDAVARLEAVPQTKQIGYYSDAYKLEFVWPKFDMYRNVLADILAEHFVDQQGWSEERAIELGRRILRDNVESIFPRLEGGSEQTRVDSQEETWIDPVAATSAALAAEAIGVVEVDEVETDLAAAPDFSGDHQDSFPTTIDEPGNTETVRMDDDDPTGSDTFDDESLDPVPSLDEIEAVNVPDVELTTDRDEPPSLASAAGEEADESEPLDVGDLWGDQPVDTEQAGIEMLRGEESFELGEESLQTEPDPVTGEWTLAYPSESDDTESNSDEFDSLATIDLDHDSDEDELDIDFEILDEDQDPEK
jgi:glucuronate isomerase